MEKPVVLIIHFGNARQSLSRHVNHVHGAPSGPCLRKLPIKQAGLHWFQVFPLSRAPNRTLPLPADLDGHPSSPHLSNDPDVAPVIVASADVVCNSTGCGKQENLARDMALFCLPYDDNLKDYLGFEEIRILYIHTVIG